MTATTEGTAEPADLERARRRADGSGRSRGRRADGSGRSRGRRADGSGRSRGRRAITLLVATLILLLLGAAVWAVRFSPLLSVQQVSVRGATTVPEAQIIAAAAVRAGTPLLAVDDQAVTERVLALPQIATVEVHRAFPRGLELVVTERVPVAVVPAGARFRTVDATGREILEVTSPGSLPVVRTASPEARAAALAVVVSLPERVGSLVESVSARTRDSVDLRLRNGARVRWGDDSRPERKAAVLLALMRQKGALYDVSAPDLPIIRG